MEKKNRFFFSYQCNTSCKVGLAESQKFLLMKKWSFWNYPSPFSPQIVRFLILFLNLNFFPEKCSPEKKKNLSQEKQTGISWGLPAACRKGRAAGASAGCCRLATPCLPLLLLLLLLAFPLAWLLGRQLGCRAGRAPGHSTSPPPSSRPAASPQLPAWKTIVNFALSLQTTTKSTGAFQPSSHGAISLIFPNRK